MSGIQVHTSSPINANSDSSPDASRNSQNQQVGSNLTQAGDNQQAETSAPVPTKTIEASHPYTASGPPPPLAGQVPRPVHPNIISAPGGPALAQPRQQPSMMIRQDLSNPPGYQQHQASFQDRPPVDGQNSSFFNPPSTHRAEGILGSEPTGTSLAEENPMWDAAKSWAKEAGQKLSPAVASVWKLVNGEK